MQSIRPGSRRGPGADLLFTKLEIPLPAHPVYPDSDKVSRARAVAVRYEAGKVYHLQGAPGIQMLEAEQIAFPNGEHDDLVDALGYAADVGGNEFSFASARW